MFTVAIDMGGTFTDLVVADEPAVVDLSSLISGTVFVKAGDTGEVTTSETTSVDVGPVPVLVSSSVDHF